jgi:hypothetical protein
MKTDGAKMAAKVNYEDDIDFIKKMTAVLKEGANLALDENYFLDKIVEDIIFINSTLEKIHGALKDASQLLNREYYLKELRSARRLFIELLDSLTEGSTSFKENMLPYFPKFLDFRKAGTAAVSEIQNILKKRNLSEEEDRDIISQEEYKFLLSDEEGHGNKKD